MVVSFRKKGVIKDDAFIYIEWSDGYDPNDNSSVREVIEEVDFEHFSNSVMIENTLPFLTFKQAEYLFRALKNHFGDFQLNLVSLANKDNGKPSIEDEPYLAPFVIDNSYTNIMTPLMYSCLCDPQFSEHSYEDLAWYFTDSENGILSIYGSSLGLSTSELPYFPLEEEIGDRFKPKQSLPFSDNKPPGPQNIASAGKRKNKRILLVSSVVGSFLVIFLIAGLIASINKNNKQEEKIAYLYNELNIVKSIQDNEHDADVFSRYFITYFYLGDKDKIQPFLSKGDVKYTQPENATISSSIFEGITPNKDETFEVKYLVVTKTNEAVNTQHMTFSIKRDEASDYGWLVTSEPVFTNYFKNQ